MIITDRNDVFKLISRNETFYKNNERIITCYLLKGHPPPPPGFRPPPDGKRLEKPSDDCHKNCIKQQEKDNECFKGYAKHEIIKVLMVILNFKQNHEVKLKVQSKRICKFYANDVNLISAHQNLSMYGRPVLVVGPYWISVLANLPHTEHKPTKYNRLVFILLLPLQARVSFHFFTYACNLVFGKRHFCTKQSRHDIIFCDAEV